MNRGMSGLAVQQLFAGPGHRPSCTQHRNDAVHSIEQWFEVVSPAEAERRRSTRYPVKVRVVYRRAGATLALEGETLNLSVDGAFVLTDHDALDVGTDVLLLFKYGKGLMLSGVVVRVSARGDRAGMGISFKDVTEEARATLREMIATSSSS